MGLKVFLLNDLLNTDDRELPVFTAEETTPLGDVEDRAQTRPRVPPRGKTTIIQTRSSQGTVKVHPCQVKMWTDEPPRALRTGFKSC